jgi:hypothetical protein
MKAAAEMEIVAARSVGAGSAVNTSAVSRVIRWLRQVTMRLLWFADLVEATQGNVSASPSDDLPSE